MARILGICGFARSGKDEFGRVLVGKGFTRVAFADSLKQEISRHLGVTVETLEEEKAIWRPLLVEWGRGRRRLDPDCWIKRASENLPAGDIVVTDVRYPNEAKWIWSLGGYLVRIIRPGVEAANEEERVSICHVDAIAGAHTFWIDNNGTVQDLHEKAKAVWQKLP